MTPELLTTISSVTIAVAVALITRRQWITSRDTLKEKLFDRRYAIYDRIAAFLASVGQSGTVAQGQEVEFLRDTKQAYFVFSGDRDVRSLVSGIYEKAVTLHALEAELPALAGAPRTSNIDAQRKIKESFADLLSSLESRFEKYLVLRQ